MSKKEAPAANPNAGPVGRNGVQCPKCKKWFAPDRINKHKDNCTRFGSRPPFDAAMHRVKGTQLEKYNKPRGSE